MTPLYNLHNHEYDDHYDVITDDENGDKFD